jgi:hypothetical protein
MHAVASCGQRPGPSFAVTHGGSAQMSCRVLCGSFSAPLSQLFTGFALLARRGTLDVHVERAKGDWRGLSGTALAVVVDDGCRIVYDTRDAARINADALEWSDHYFKRSFDAAAVPDGADGKVSPLGFNYPVYTGSDWQFRRMLWTVVGASPKALTNTAQAILDLSRSLSAISARTTGRAACTLETFEAPPGTRPSPRVLLLTRTWDPATVRHDPALADAWSAINRLRAGCIRALRKELGSRVLAGLAPTRDAVRDYPDCVVDDARITKKRTYLEVMQQSDICVASAGLAGSNGWRLGEYIASSRAIVSEALQSEVPGPFALGQNYAEFEDPAGCVEATMALVEDGQLRGDMMAANHAYYRSHLRPDVLVLNSLRRAGLVPPADAAGRPDSFT